MWLLESKRPAKLVALDHATGKGIRATQKMGGGFYITFLSARRIFEELTAT